ncbi:MAG TPA: hypothetical protein VIJ58_12955 [Candidatus Dormibacteraeota bacterium]
MEIEAMAPPPTPSPSLMADLVWGVRRGALVALVIASLLIGPWLIVGSIATLSQPR